MRTWSVLLALLLSFSLSTQEEKVPLIFRDWQISPNQGF